MSQETIILYLLEPFDEDIVSWISEDISHLFHYPVHVMESATDLSPFYSPGRRQYDANKILELVTDMSPPSAAKSIGLLKVDLFIPIFTYIFGQATVKGNAGIVSLYRLRNELYGLRRNYMLQIERLRKVVVHELGHTFGLIHCFNPECVMRSSTYVEDLDQKGIDFCSSCEVELDKRRG